MTYGQLCYKCKQSLVEKFRTKMKYLGYGGTSTIFRGALCLCYRLKTNKLKSDIHVNMPQKRKFSLSLGCKHNRTIKRSAHDLKAIVVFHYPLYVVCNPSMCKKLYILCPESNYRGQIVWSLLFVSLSI